MSDRKCRPRRVLLMALGVFVAAQVGFGLWADNVAPLFRFVSLQRVLARLARKGTQPEVVVLGSSRLEGAVSEAEAAGAVSVLNAAVPAGDATAQEAVLDKVLASGARPRRVVMEVSPEFFNWYNFCAGFNVVRLYRWQDLPTHLMPIALTSNLPRLAVARMMPVYEHRSQAWDLLRGRAEGPLDAAPLPLGPAPPRHANRASPPLGSPLTGEKRALLLAGARHAGTSWLREYRIDRVNADALMRMVARCRGLGCEVILVAPPLSSPHRAIFTPQVEAAYREIVRETGCRYVDGRDWVPDEFFADSHHVTADGGRLFTRRLVREVLEGSEAP